MSTPAQDIHEVPPLDPQSKATDRSVWNRPLGAVLLALIFGAVIFIVSSGADYLMVHEHETARTTIELSDALSALVIAALAFRLIRLQQDRRWHLRQRVEVISDVNHHVRNALQVISLTSHGKDKEEITAIRESVNRIQWALRELLPKI